MTTVIIMTLLPNIMFHLEVTESLLFKKKSVAKYLLTKTNSFVTTKQIFCHKKMKFLRTDEFKGTFRTSDTFFKGSLTDFFVKAAR